LGDVGLSSLSSHPNPMVSQLCHELLGIRRQLKRAAPRLWQPKRHGVRNMFGMGHSGNPVYFACSLVMSDDGLVGELLDSHYESEAGSGEATTYQSFVPIAAQASEIRKQFTDWKHAFQLLGSLDRVLALISA
jgi:PRTRC genetic system protein F